MGGAPGHLECCVALSLRLPRLRLSGAYLAVGEQGKPDGCGGGTELPTALHMVPVGRWFAKPLFRCPYIRADSEAYKCLPNENQGRGGVRVIGCVPSISTIPFSKWLMVHGSCPSRTVFEDKVQEQEIRVYEGKRWFNKDGELLHLCDRTYALSNQ